MTIKFDTEKYESTKITHIIQSEAFQIQISEPEKGLYHGYFFKQEGPYGLMVLSHSLGNYDTNECDDKKNVMREYADRIPHEYNADDDKILIKVPQMSLDSGIEVSSFGTIVKIPLSKSDKEPTAQELTDYAMVTMLRSDMSDDCIDAIHIENKLSALAGFLHSFDMNFDYDEGEDKHIFQIESAGATKLLMRMVPPYTDINTEASIGDAMDDINEDGLTLRFVNVDVDTAKGSDLSSKFLTAEQVTHLLKDEPEVELLDEMIGNGCAVCKSKSRSCILGTRNDTDIFKHLGPYCNGSDAAYKLMKGLDSLHDFVNNEAIIKIKLDTIAERTKN